MGCTGFDTVGVSCLKARYCRRVVGGWGIYQVMEGFLVVLQGLPGFLTGFQGSPGRLDRLLLSRVS